MDRNELSWLLDALDLHGKQMLVQANLAAFGEVDGGATTVCRVLMENVGESGTILMPTFTYVETLGEPIVDDQEPRPRPVAFHADMPVSAEIGEVAETFRRLPGVLRSSHPSHSFSAWGRHARDMLSTQRDNNTLGPLKKLSLAQGHVVLLGTTLDSATVIHLAEEQLHVPYLQRRTASRLNSAGYDERVVIENVPGCSFAFRRLEPSLDPEVVRSVRLPRGWGLVVPVRYLVRLALTTLQKDPDAFVCERIGCVGCDVKRAALSDRRPAIRAEVAAREPISSRA
jgi:aminoglycoside N3'-acetyltransferase